MNKIKITLEKDGAAELPLVKDLEPGTWFVYGGTGYIRADDNNYWTHRDTGIGYSAQAFRLANPRFVAFLSNDRADCILGMTPDLSALLEDTL